MNLELRKGIPEEARNFRIDRKTPTKESLIPKRLRPSLDEEEFPALRPTEKYIPEHQASQLSIKELAGRAIADVELDEDTPIPLDPKDLAENLADVAGIERDEFERRPKEVSVVTASRDRASRQELVNTRREKEERQREANERLYTAPVRPTNKGANTPQVRQQQAQGLSARLYEYMSSL
ncbi:MAG: hypothetical protein WC802_01270 [Patescibacteria group bacterium]|jgi:hypothetical protein